MHQEADMSNPVKFVRLNTGEDIITEVMFIRDEAEHYLFINPMKIVYNLGTKPDSLLVAFSPWIFSSICERQEFPIFPNDVITIADPSEDVVDCYWEFIDKMTKAKVKTLGPQKAEPDYAITEEEEEFLRNVLDNIGKEKRKLH